MQNIILSTLPLNELESLVLNQVRKALSEVAPTATDLIKDELLTAEEVAALLSVSIPTVYGYVYKKEIPYMKKRGKLYFNKGEILEWVKSSRRMTREEIRQVAAESLNR